jgi:hypothetical protein
MNYIDFDQEHAESHIKITFDVARDLTGFSYRYGTHTGTSSSIRPESSMSLVFQLAAIIVEAIGEQKTKVTP